MNKWHEDEGGIESEKIVTVQRLAGHEKTDGVD